MTNLITDSKSLYPANSEKTLNEGGGVRAFAGSWCCPADPLEIDCLSV
jgi:hypothetical protein